MIQFHSFSQENKTTVFQINGGFGQFAPHKKSIAYLLDGKASSLSFSIENRNVDSIHFGITGSILNSGNSDIIGMIYGLNGFSSFPLGKKKDAIRLRIGVGIGYVEKIFDANKNNQNIAIGSHFNAKIVFRAEKELKLSDQSKLNLGLGVCHFSNGSFQTPNLGLNFLMANIGYSYVKTRQNNIPTTSPDSSSTVVPLGKVYSKWHYSVMLTGGARENLAPLRRKYAIVNLNNRINYTRNTKKQFATGIDITYNPGIKQSSDSTLAISPFQGGFFIGNERSFGPMTFSIDMGIYLFNQNLRSLFYHRFGVHFKVSKKMKLLFQLKSHWAVAEAFEFGLNYRIK